MIVVVLPLLLISHFGFSNVGFKQLGDRFPNFASNIKRMQEN